MANEFIARNGITSLGNIIVSGSITSTGAITISGSIASASFATTAATASSADSLLVRSTLTAQTLVVQTITSSVDFVTGSTRFGSIIGNTHQFTGSVITSGSVGIGTTPAHSLTLVGGQTTPGSFSAGNYTFGIYSGSVSTVLRETFAMGSDNSYVYMQSFSSKPLYINRDGNNIILGSSAASVNVGVGTTSPGDFIDANLGLAIISTSGRTGLSIGSTQGTANEVLGRLSFTNTNSTNIGSKRLAYISGLRGTTDNSAYLEFGTADNALGTQRMVITQGGNVFINNSSGVSLNGLTNFLSVSSTTYNLFDISRFSDNAFGPNFYLVKSRNASVGGNTIVANGDNLGNITWVGANGTGFTDAANIRAEVDGTPGASNDMPGRLVFSTTADGSGSTTERMRITSGGNVGIGTSSPGAPLHIALSSSAASGETLRLVSKDSIGDVYQTFYRYGGTTRKGYLGYGYGAQDYFEINQEENADIIISTNATERMRITAGGLTTLSDQRIKDNVQPLTNSLDKVLQLNGKKFHLKDEPEDKIRYGFIAQDLEGILDEFVINTDMKFEKDGEVVENVKSIENWASSWAALLVEAIKELKAENDSLITRIEQLESK